MRPADARAARPHILQVIGSGAMGGGTTMVLALSRALRSRGFDITIASHRESGLLDEARQSDIRTLGIDFSSRRKSLDIASGLKQFAAGTRVDLIHAHGPRAGVPVALMPDAYRVPSVYTVHGFHFLIKPVGVRQIARGLERFCMRRTQATIFVCASDQQIAASSALVSPERSAVIYNGSKLAPSEQADAMPKRFDIAFLGRLCPQKNPLMLTRILLAMRPARPKLAIIGAGELEGPLRHELADAGLIPQVTFYGLQSHGDGLALLRQARTMVLPSLAEGMPMSVIEAMHLGVPTVASRVGGTGELIEDGVSGFLVPPDDVKSFADCLTRLLDDAALHDRIAAQARLRAQAEFSEEHNVDRHIALYHRLLTAAA